MFVPEENLLGELNEGFKLIMANFQWERLAMALGAVGAMQLAWERTAAVRARAQRVRPPAVRAPGDPPQARRPGHQRLHRRCVTYDALRRFVAGEEPLREVTMAKLLTQRASFELMDDCLQIHGGAGLHARVLGRARRPRRAPRPDRRRLDEIMREILGRVLAL